MSTPHNGIDMAEQLEAPVALNVGTMSSVMNTLNDFGYDVYLDDPEYFYVLESQSFAEGGFTVPDKVAGEEPDLPDGAPFVARFSTFAEMQAFTLGLRIGEASNPADVASL